MSNYKSYYYYNNTSYFLFSIAFKKPIKEKTIINIKSSITVTLVSNSKSCFLHNQGDQLSSKNYWFMFWDTQCVRYNSVILTERGEYRAVKEHFRYVTEIKLL